MATEGIIFEQIVDCNFDQSISTSSPNATINVVQLLAAGTGTDIAMAISPKGTGYISAQVPDGTATGGNARGANAVDFQMSRNVASQVASGTRSFVAGSANTASGTDSTAIGQGSVASSNASVAVGVAATASGVESIAIGRQNAATGLNSVAVGILCTSSGIASLSTGRSAISHLTYMRAHGGFGLQVAGASQEIALVLAGKTTTNAEVVLEIFSGISPILKADSVWSLMLHIVGSKSDGSAVARYHRQVTIKRVANTTTLVGSAVTVGTDEAAGTTINITADDATDRLSVGVTGIAAETWRWVAVCHGVEMLIGA